MHAAVMSRAPVIAPPMKMARRAPGGAGVSRAEEPDAVDAAAVVMARVWVRMATPSIATPAISRMATLAISSLDPPSGNLDSCRIFRSEWSFGLSPEWPLMATTSSATLGAMSSQPRAADRIAPYPRRRIAILPPQASPPQAAPAESPASAPPPVGDRSLVERAEALGIPWGRILGEEIRAEQALRRYISDLDAFPLVAPLAVLSFSFL